MGKDYHVIDLEILEKELKETVGLKEEEIEKNEEGNLPWTIKKDGYIFQITEEGKVNVISGVLVSDENRRSKWKHCMEYNGFFHSNSGRGEYHSGRRKWNSRNYSKCDRN